MLTTIVAGECYGKESRKIIIYGWKSVHLGGSGALPLHFKHMLQQQKQRNFCIQGNVLQIMLHARDV